MLSEPETYDLDAAATLAHTVDARRPDGFEAHWRRFDDAVRELPVPRWPVADPSTRVEFVSVGSVRVVGQLTRPEGPPRGAVVTSHGYHVDAPHIGEANEAWLEQGLAVLEIRVRGYEPSTQDVPRGGDEWILRGLEAPAAWIVHCAVGDLVAAVRALRCVLPAGAPVSIHGESLGGGLAVTAAARLTGMGEPPHRLALGLPSLGDWTWRRGRYSSGAGGLVNMFLESLRTDADALVDGLLLADAALHAPDVTCPVLCKLAERDDAVPAPSAAAIYNALGSTAKERFVVPYGHYEGGLANARKHLAFERRVVKFLTNESENEE